MEMNAIAAVVIGGTSLSGGSGTMLGTIIGVFIMAVLKNGLMTIGIQQWQVFFTGPGSVAGCNAGYLPQCKAKTQLSMEKEGIFSISS